MARQHAGADVTGGKGPMGMITTERAVKRLARRTPWEADQWRPAVTLLGEHVRPDLVDRLVVLGCSPEQLQRLAGFTEEQLRGTTKAPNRAARRRR